jgi:integrase
MEESRFVFNVKSLSEVVCPSSGKADKSGRVYVYDSHDRAFGLCLCVTETGTRTFYVNRRVNGAFKRHKIGRFPDVTIDQGRRAAADLTNLIARGIDPTAAKREAKREAAKVEPTLEDMWNLYRESHLLLKKCESVRNYTYRYNKHLQPFRNVHLKDITPEFIETIKIRIGKTHKHAANGIVNMLSAMFTRTARRFGLPKGHNPADEVSRFQAYARMRVASQDELGRFVEVLRAHKDHTVRDYFLMLLYTGQRRTNVQRMRWEDIDIQRATWTLSGQKTKNGKPLVVPLISAALELLRQRPDHSPWVFPSESRITAADVERLRSLRTGGMTRDQAARAVGVGLTTASRAMDPTYTRPECVGPITSMWDMWHKIKVMAGVGLDITIHDLRRTICTNLIEQGVPLPIVTKIMGHSSSQVTLRHYAHARVGAVAEAAEIGSKKMFAAMEGRVSGSMAG